MSARFANQSAPRQSWSGSRDDIEVAGTVHDPASTEPPQFPFSLPVPPTAHTTGPPPVAPQSSPDTAPAGHWRRTRPPRRPPFAFRAPPLLAELSPPSTPTRASPGKTAASSPPPATAQRFPSPQASASIALHAPAPTASSRRTARP